MQGFFGRLKYSRLRAYCHPVKLLVAEGTQLARTFDIVTAERDRCVGKLKLPRYSMFPANGSITIAFLLTVLSLIRATSVSQN